MKLFQVLIALFFSAALLSGCNNAEESAPATDAAPATTEPAAPAPAAEPAAPAESAAPAAEPAQEEPGGWVPPAEGS
ncbi:MAG TPA: hypothetical protein VFF75_10905 [Methylophilaceae bacterium]|nr:hypothetical protein [Methylophilaceae bacterium]